MINVEVSTVINRPVADVFAFVANFKNYPKWETVKFYAGWRRYNLPMFAQIPWTDSDLKV